MLRRDKVARCHPRRTYTPTKIPGAATVEVAVAVVAAGEMTGLAATAVAARVGGARETAAAGAAISLYSASYTNAMLKC